MADKPRILCVDQVLGSDFSVRAITRCPNFMFTILPSSSPNAVLRSLSRRNPGYGAIQTTYSKDLREIALVHEVRSAYPQLPQVAVLPADVDPEQYAEVMHPKIIDRSLAGFLVDEPQGLAVLNQVYQELVDPKNKGRSGALDHYVTQKNGSWFM